MSIRVCLEPLDLHACKTTAAEHFISTTGTPVKVPLRAEVESQIQHILQDEIIKESPSPWLAPVV